MADPLSNDPIPEYNVGALRCGSFVVRKENAIANPVSVALSPQRVGV